MHGSLARVVSLAVLTLSALPAQDTRRPLASDRPAVPPGGLPTTEHDPLVVAYSDGYRTRGHLVAPLAAVPAGGWPLVVHVHQLGGNHCRDAACRTREWQHAIARSGFAVWSYAVRGQGDAIAEVGNPFSIGTTMWGGAELCDLAEQIEFVRARHDGVVSRDLLAVTGESQGGVHAWLAAAYSGRTLAVPGRTITVFPRVAAVAPFDFVADAIGQTVRERALFSRFSIELVADRSFPNPFLMDAGHRLALRDAFERQDPAGFADAQTAEPGRATAELLASSDVPVFFAHAYHDTIASPELALRVLATLPATTPWRALLSTIGHGTPHSDGELRLREQIALRWLERFLWRADNGVEHEARIVRAVLPLDGAERDDPAHAWGHVFDSAHRDDDYTVRRLFLTVDGRLDADGAASAGTLRIDHTVRAGYDATTFLRDEEQRTTAGVLAAIPLSEQVFTTAAMAAEVQLGAGSTLELDVVAETPRLVLAALLSVRLPDGGGSVMLTSAGAAFTVVPGRLTTVALELPGVAAVLPAGAVLELSVRNHWLREAPMPRELETAPLFESNRVLVFAGRSRLDLRTRRAVAVRLATTETAIDLLAPGVTAFEVRAGAVRAGAFYALLASMSGHGPDALLPGLPLRFDAMTALVLELYGMPAAPGFFGRLSEAGTARARFDLSFLPRLPPDFLGVRLTFAAWVLDGAAGTLRGTPSNPVDLIVG